MTESTFNKAKALNDHIDYLSALLDLFESFVDPDVFSRNKAIASIEVKSMKEDIAMKLAAVVRKELNEAKREFSAL